MIDSQGYRENVGIVLANQNDQLFWARRINEKAWQFPQGGRDLDESLEQCLFRELYEETGLTPDHVDLLGRTQDWLYYDLPQPLVRHHQQPICIGQKQIWFALRLQVADDLIRLDATDSPEFDAWRWVSYWLPVDDVVAFKQQVYRSALMELKTAIKQ